MAWGRKKSGGRKEPLFGLASAMADLRLSPLDRIGGGDTPRDYKPKDAKKDSKPKKAAPKSRPEPDDDDDEPPPRERKPSVSHSANKRRGTAGALGRLSRRAVCWCYGSRSACAPAPAVRHRLARVCSSAQPFSACCPS